MEKFNYFSLMAISIFMEASPFLLIGALLSATMELFIPKSFFERNIPKSTSGRILTGLFMGMIMPTCECAIIPITRRLLLKGVPVRTAITYLLSASVINPLVIVSTIIAFRYDASLIYGRIIIVALSSIFISLYFFSDDEEILLEEIENEHCCHSSHCDHEEKSENKEESNSKIYEFFRNFTHDFFVTIKYLILGCLAAAFLKTYTPQGFLELFTGNFLLSVIAMMILGFFLSVCSAADAFVAKSFVMFPKFSQLIFVTFGPQLDSKLIFLYFGTFKKSVVRKLIIGTVTVNIILVLLYKMLFVFMGQG